MTTHNSVSHRDALDVVFEHRNRAYGAYQLRREYPKTLARALGIGLLLIAAMVLLPRILSAFSALLPEKPLNDLVITPTMIVVEAPPPPVIQGPPPPPEMKAAVEFTPPVVAPDDEVPEEKPRDVQSILDDSRDVGSKTIEGPDDGPPTLDPPSEGLGVLETATPADDAAVDGFAVNKMPSFPGGDAEMFQWIYKNLKYPDQAREAGIFGLVALQFVVGKDGSITDIIVLKTPAGGAILGKEATRVIQSMPKWNPGENNGHPVKVRYTLPLRFELK